MKIVFMGTPDFASCALEALIGPRGGGVLFVAEFIGQAERCGVLILCTRACRVEVVNNSVELHGEVFRKVKVEPVVPPARWRRGEVREDVEGRAVAYLVLPEALVEGDIQRRTYGAEDFCASRHTIEPLFIEAVVDHCNHIARNRSYGNLIGCALGRIGETDRDVEETGREDRRDERLVGARLETVGELCAEVEGGRVGPTIADIPRHNLRNLQLVDILKGGAVDVVDAIAGIDGDVVRGRYR